MVVCLLMWFVCCFICRPTARMYPLTSSSPFSSSTYPSSPLSLSTATLPRLVTNPARPPTLSPTLQPGPHATYRYTCVTYTSHPYTNIMLHFCPAIAHPSPRAENNYTLLFLSITLHFNGFIVIEAPQTS